MRPSPLFDGSMGGGGAGAWALNRSGSDEEDAAVWSAFFLPAMDSEFRNKAFALHDSNQTKKNMASGCGTLSHSMGRR